MPTPIEEDLLGRIDTEVLWQPFVERVNTMLNACAARGCYYAGLAGFRPREEQDALYAIGRTTGKIGHVVTMVRGGESRHQHYCAIDFGRDADRAKPGLQYLTAREDYRVLAEEAVKAGLEAGFYWNSEGRTGFSDPPHVEAPVRAWGIKTAELESAYRFAHDLTVASTAAAPGSARAMASGRAAVIALLDGRSQW